MFRRSGKHRVATDPAKLEALGNSEALALLLGTGPDATTRQAAAASLGRIGGVRAVVALKAALKDRDTAVRVEAVDALGVLKGARAADALLEALRGHDRDVRGAALQQLVQMAEPRVLPVLVEMARDPRSPLRRAAVSALGAFRDPSALDTLLEAAQDPDQTLSDLAATGLGRVGGRRAVPVLLRIRSPASVRALGRIGHPSAVAGLVQTLGNVRKDILRDGAADALLAIHRAHPGLHLEALARTRGEVRQLAACGDARAVTPLCGWLFAPDPTHRILATRGLARLGDSTVLGLLTESLRDPVPEVCLAAADAMQIIDPDRDWDPLCETILQHMTNIAEAGEDQARIDDLLASIDFLGRLRATLALPTLHGLEEHPEWSVREAAGRALTLIAGSKR